MFANFKTSLIKSPVWVAIETDIYHVKLNAMINYSQHELLFHTSVFTSIGRWSNKFHHSRLNSTNVLHMLVPSQIYVLLIYILSFVGKKQQIQTKSSSDKSLDISKMCLMMSYIHIHIVSSLTERSNPTSFQNKVECVLKVIFHYFTFITKHPSPCLQKPHHSRGAYSSAYHDCMLFNYPNSHQTVKSFVITCPENGRDISKVNLNSLLFVKFLCLWTNEYFYGKHESCLCIKCEKRLWITNEDVVTCLES